MNSNKKTRTQLVNASRLVLRCFRWNGGGGKPEGRNPKAERNPKSEIRIAKPRPAQTSRKREDPRPAPFLRASEFGFLSDFGLRVSDLIGDDSTENSNARAAL